MCVLFSILGVNNEIEFHDKGIPTSWKVLPLIPTPWKVLPLLIDYRFVLLFASIPRYDCIGAL